MLHLLMKLGGSHTSPFVASWRHHILSKLWMPVSTREWCLMILNKSDTEAGFGSLLLSLESQPNEISKPAFLAITAHTYSDAPVTYIHPRAFAETQKTEARKKPQLNQTSCWSLLVVPEENGSMSWAKATVGSSWAILVWYHNDLLFERGYSTICYTTCRTFLYPNSP